MENPFDEAQAIVVRWPADKNAPGELRALYDRTGSWEVSMFVEALHAAARTGPDTALIEEAWGDVEDEL